MVEMKTNGINQWLSPKYVNCGVIFCHDLLKCHADILSSWFFVKHKPVKQIVLVKKGKTEKSKGYDEKKYLLGTERQSEK